MNPARDEEELEHRDEIAFIPMLHIPHINTVNRLHGGDKDWHHYHGISRLCELRRGAESCSTEAAQTR
jgi:hypothetical protein